LLEHGFSTSLNIIQVDDHCGNPLTALWTEFLWVVRVQVGFILVSYLILEDVEWLVREGATGVQCVAGISGGSSTSSSKVSRRQAKSSAATGAARFEMNSLTWPWLAGSRVTSAILCSKLVKAPVGSSFLWNHDGMSAVGDSL
jgi:hypothetical protein